MTRASRIIVVAAALALAATGARAESIFGLNLLGERIDAGDVRAIALGGQVHLLDDSLGVLQLNPAMMSYATKVTFGASQFLASDLSSSELGEEQETGAKFTTFAFAFPLFNRLAIALSYHGRYDADGGFTSEKVSSAGEAYREEFIRKGGLNSYQVAAAADVTRFVKVGAFYSFENGSIENRWNTIFEEAGQAPAFNIQERTLSGNGWGVGLVVRPLRQVMLGLTYEGEVEYDVDVLLRYTNNAAAGRSTETMVMPSRLTASGLWRTGRFAVYAGGSITDFEQFEGLGFPEERLYREEVASLGLEYLRGFPLFGRRFPVRLSFTYERLPFDFPEGERVQRIVGGIGTGLKFNNGRGKIDFALQTGKIGSKDTNGLETRVLRLYVGVSGAEIWKRQRSGAY